MIKILFICHGNICRSPMAESVMTHFVQEAGLGDQFKIASAATSREEIGMPVHEGTVRKLRQEGIRLVPHRAAQVTGTAYDKYDLFIGMDQWNLKNMRRILGNDPEGKIHLLLDFTSRPGDIADPWYSGNFDATFRDVLEGCQGLLDWCRDRGMCH